MIEQIVALLVLLLLPGSFAGLLGMLLDWDTKEKK